MNNELVTTGSVVTPLAAPKMTKREVTIKGIEKDGRVDVTTLTEKQRQYYLDIAKNLDERDMSSVSSYGSDLQRAMDSYSNDFLNQQMTSQGNVESAKLIANLLGELKEVDIADLEAPGAWKRFMRKFPILRNFVVSIEQVKAKYNTIQKNIDGIVEKLQATRLIAIRDNDLLQKQFENNISYVGQIEDLIIAGKIKSQDLDAEINKLQNEGAVDEIIVSDLIEYKNSLDKRVNDLMVLRYAFKQSLMQIRIIQRTNMMDANNTESQITMTIPLWKNQLSLAVALYNQKQSIEIKSKVTDATNAILRKNAEMMKQQTLEVVKQNERSVIDIETLKKSTADVIATIEGVQKIQKDGAAKRAQAEAELLRLEKNISALASGVQESTTRIISSELRGKTDPSAVELGEEFYIEE